MMPQMKTALRQLLARTEVRGIMSRVLPRYEYNFTPPQLIFLCDCLERTRDLPGTVVEIGCATGRTTIFLNKYLESVDIRKRYVCIDTFEGFTESDVQHEVQSRGKSDRGYETSWKDWSNELFARTMTYNKLDSVEVVQADIGTYDCSGLGAPSFCLIDVDLYIPVKKSLEKIYGLMPKGAIIVVDDCSANHKYDGARQAYCEFVKQCGLPERYHLHKLGVIEVV